MSHRDRVRIASWLSVIVLLLFVGTFSTINARSETRGLIYYGLDIEGGIDLLLKAVPPEGSDSVREDQMRGLVSVLRNRIDPQGTKELYFTDPDGTVVQLQDVRYAGGCGSLGEIRGTGVKHPF